MPLEFELREHRSYAGYVPVMVFEKLSPTDVSVDSFTSGTASIGQGYCFHNFSRTYLDGKRLRIRWMTEISPDFLGTIYFEVVDGHYDRESMVDFPDNADRIWKGSGQLELIAWRNTSAEWEIVTSGVLDLSGGTEDECCVFIWIRDARDDARTRVRVDYFEVLDADLNRLWYEHFLADVDMDVTGTYNDYGTISIDAMYKIEGVTRDYQREPLGNCPVWLFRTVDKTFLEDVVSDENGNYEFIMPDNVTEHYLLSHKDGVPNVFGRTDRDIKGEVP